MGRLSSSFERTAANSIWLHAVSVGEIASALPLIRQLRADRPQVPIYLSTSTVAGRRAAMKQADALVNGIFYAPLDFAGIVRRVLRTIRPAVVIVLETEIWPNLYHETKRTQAGLVLMNARISGRTWPTYRRLRWFFASVLKLPDAIFTQGEEDVARYLALGAEAAKVSTEGNLKYDAASVARTANLNTYGAEHVWIAASTVGPNERGSVHKHSVDEDDIVLATFRQLAERFPRLLLVLAPRQPARFEVVAGKLKTQGLPFVRRTAGGTQQFTLPGVLLLDTIGELAGWYNAADVAFVGGSLAPRGGHNVLEPAAAGVPVVVGPHMQNFEAIAADLRECGGLVQIDEAGQLTPAIARLLSDRNEAQRMGEAGRAQVEAKAGMARRVAPGLWHLYDDSFPTHARSGTETAVLGALANVWRKEAARRRARTEERNRDQAPLAVPVISIGGISVGGSGKTPLANQLARELRNRGWNPGILTRGYRRRSTAEHILLAPGRLVTPAFSGDEAHIFLRSGYATVGIGSDRHRTAQKLLHHFPHVNVLILDDGFQHARLKRDVDVVVIDGMDPWGGGNLVPLGRLREPLSMLSRASAIVVTRAEDSERFAAISTRLREIASDVPVFRSRTKPVGWRDPFTNELAGGPGELRTAAFCGLGNPANFWRTLEQLRIQPMFRWAFRDHHRYRVNEVHGLIKLAKAHDVRWLLTTEKDCNNLPEGTSSWLNGIRMAWLEIEIEIEDGDRFYGELLRRAEKLRARGLGFAQRNF